MPFALFSSTNGKKKSTINCVLTEFKAPLGSTGQKKDSK
jgi:hypothetical protein